MTMAYRQRLLRGLPLVTSSILVMASPGRSRPWRLRWSQPWEGMPGTNLNKGKVVKEGQAKNMSRRCLLAGAKHYVGLLEAGRQGKPLVSGSACCMLLMFLIFCLQGRASWQEDVRRGRKLL